MTKERDVKHMEIQNTALVEVSRLESTQCHSGHNNTSTKDDSRYDGGVQPCFFFCEGRAGREIWLTFHMGDGDKIFRNLKYLMLQFDMSISTI